MNEMRVLFIEFRFGNFGGLDFGLEPKLRFGDQIRRENYNHVALIKSREGVWWNQLIGSIESFFGWGTKHKMLKIANFRQNSQQKPVSNIWETGFFN